MLACATQETAGVCAHKIKQFLKHFNMGYAAGTTQFRKFGGRCPLCEITGIFPCKHPAFAFYTGFIK
jgi:hypothetical protein